MSQATPIAPSLPPQERAALGFLLDAGYLCQQALSTVLSDAESDDLPPRQAASQSLLARYADMPIEKIPDDERDLMESALQQVLGLSAQPSIAQFAKGSASAHREGEAALIAIDRLRAGQPDIDLYLATSPRAQEAVGYLADQFASRRPLGRLIVGEMGQGKSTLAEAVQAKAGAGHIVMLPHVVLRESRFSTPRTIVTLVLQRKLLLAAFQQIMATALINPESQVIKQAYSAVTVPPIDGLFRAIVNYLVKHPEMELLELLVDDLIYALGAWLRPNGIITPVRDLLKEIGSSAGFSIRFSDVEPMDLMRSFIGFYAATRVYPVWLVDEFESYAQLNRGQGDMALGFYREFFDSLYAEHGTGALILMSTPDGQTMIRNYGGFDGRLMGSDTLTMSSTTWEIAEFSAWEPDTLLNYLLGLYEAGAHVGDALCQRVADMRPVFDELFASPQFRESLADTTALPRERIKAVTSLLDLAMDGEEAVRDNFGRLMEAPDDLIEQPHDPMYDTPSYAPVIDADLPHEPWKGDSGPWSIDAPESSGFSDFPDSPADVLLEDEVPCTSTTNGLGGEIAAFLNNDEQGFNHKDAAGDGLSLIEPGDADFSDSENWPMMSPAASPQPPADGLTNAGRERRAIKVIEDRAWLGWVPSPSMPKTKPMMHLIFHAASSGHTAGRLARFRDDGGSAASLWQSLLRSGERKDQEVCAQWLYLDTSNPRTTRQLEVFAEMLDSLLALDAPIRVMMPHSTTADAEAYSDYIKRLRHEDKADVAALRQQFGVAAIPAARKHTVRFPHCHVATSIVPLADIQLCRHFVYAVGAHLRVLPEDQWVDRYVLHRMNQAWGLRPATSRKGIQFYTLGSTLLGMFDRRRSLAVEPMATATDENDHRAPDQPDWVSWKRRILVAADTPAAST